MISSCRGAWKMNEEATNIEELIKRLPEGYDVNPQICYTCITYVTDAQCFQYCPLPSGINDLNVSNLRLRITPAVTYNPDSA